MKRFIAHEDLSSALAKLAEKFKVWIPAALREGTAVVEFLPYRPGLEPVLERQSTQPAKKILLPQVEVLLSFEYRKDEKDPSKTSIHLEEPKDSSAQTLVFGARPCDVRGHRVLDPVFTGGPFIDGSYRERRKNTLFATLVCREADGACFCSSVGSGPADMEGSDLSLTPVSGGLLIEALREEAQSVLEGIGRAATPGEEEEAGRVIEEALAMRVGEVDLEGCASSFLKRFEDKAYWEEASSQCLGCGICTFVCPTCYCFNITDETIKLRGERLRSWDSCMFCSYTSEASGHNPRPTKLERYRNRVGHKFSYIPEKYEGLIGCCGCGRCIRSCPSSIDIRGVVSRLKEEACECA